MAIDDELKAQILRYHFVEHWRVGTIASQLGVPSVPAWSLSTLPRHMPVEDVERTIESCDTATPAGTRDRAALLLLARLALRAGDVVALRLTDIDWDRALLRVNGKTRRDTLLPLPQDVGDALHAYIASARPRIDEPRVFLAVNAPFRPISGSGVVSAIARRAFERAGVVPPATRGAHTMRHSAATGWLRAGMPMEAIRVLLRHRSSSTTAIYGLGLAHAPGVLTPYAGLTLGDGRTIRTGARWQVSLDAALGVEAHRAARDAADPDMGLRLEARLRF